MFNSVMRLGYASLFYFLFIYVIAQSGIVTFPEPFQSIVMNYGLVFICIAVGFCAVPILLACIMMVAERDRDISRSETWEEESSGVTILGDQR